ncbi:MAG: sulfotransferase family 2 domain-containing protein [Nitrosopumilaceae archaeon]
MLQNNTLYFLHIPKTAGTTIISIIDNYFNSDSILPEEVWNHLLKNFPSDFTKYRLIRGHFGYGIHRLFPTKPIYMTMLRDPIERTISSYHHITVDPIANNWIKLSKVESLTEMIDDPKMSLFFRNTQTRHLALDLDVIDTIRSLNKDELHDFLYESSSEFLSPNITGDKMLKIAKQHLSEFAFFGITERFEESLLLMCYTFGWNPPHKIWKQMVLPGRPAIKDFPTDTVEKIRKNTELDNKLYQYAVKIFDKRFRVMMFELEKKYGKKFENKSQIERIYQLLEKQYSEKIGISIPKINSIDYRFNEPLLGDGWHMRENYNKSGRIFRWTGPDNVSTINFPLNQNNDLKIRFNVIMSLSDDILKSIVLKVNDNPVPLDIVQQRDGETIFEGFIQKSFLTNPMKFTRFTLSLSHTLIPNSINPKLTDKRLLGIAIDKILIF